MYYNNLSSAAARVGDKTAHGTPLYPGSGSGNVIINGKPAWRCNIDSHLCPLSEGSKPHAKGTVTNGSKTVLINGSPAARMGDIIVEAGPPNMIAEGAYSVLIG